MSTLAGCSWPPNTTSANGTTASNCVPPLLLQQVAETVHHLLEIINAYETAMESRPTAGPSSNGSSASLQPDELGPVLSAVLEPLTEMCERSAEALTPDAPSRVDEVARLDPSAHHVYLVNCLAAVWSVLQHRAATSTRARQVGGRASLEPQGWTGCRCVRYGRPYPCYRAFGMHCAHRCLQCESFHASSRVLRVLSRQRWSVSSQVLDSIEAHTAALVGSEVGRLLASCGMAEVVERLRLYQQQQEQEVRAHVVIAGPWDSHVMLLVSYSTNICTANVLVVHRVLVHA